MSRFEKIPLYLQWAGVIPSGSSVTRYCQAFSTAVRQGVTESEWVPGAREYLQANCKRQRFVLISATPQEEIEGIVSSLGILGCFSDVFGTPTDKLAALNTILAASGCERGGALLIGDSEVD